MLFSPLREGRKGEKKEEEGGVRKEKKRKEKKRKEKKRKEKKENTTKHNKTQNKIKNNLLHCHTTTFPSPLP